VKNNLVSILNQDQVLENSVQRPKLEVKTFITKDRSLLDQYYQMRHDAYTRENGWQGYDGSENKHDRAGNIIVAMKDDKVVGGARIMFSSECETLSNDVLREDVSHLSIIQKYDKRENLILEPINVDYRTGISPRFWINFDIKKGLENWSIILHEVIGISYYKITGKI
jgi:hypothetical protein